MTVKRTVLALCFMFCAQFAVGQMGKDDSMAETASFVDNVSYAHTHNVWHLSNTTLTSVAAGVDIVGGLDSAGHPFFYTDYPTNSWSQNTAMGTVFKLIPVNASLIYSMQNDGLCGGVGAHGQQYHVFKWTGSAWTTTGMGCVFDFSASDDGELIATYLYNGNVFIEYSNGNGQWSGTSLGGGWKNVAAMNQTTAIATGDSSDPHVYQLDLPNQAWTRLTGVTTSLYPSAHGENSVIVIDTSGNVQLWNGSAWSSVMGGPFTSVANGGSMNQWAIGPTQSGSNVWRFPDHAVQLTETYTTHTLCGTCAGATHTPKLVFKFAGSHHTGGGTVQGNGAYPTVYNPVAMTDTLTDPFFCGEPGSECSVDLTSTGTTNCTITGGTIFTTAVLGAGGGPKFHYVKARTRVDTGSSTSCFASSLFHCGPSSPGCSYTGPWQYRCTQHLNVGQLPDYNFGTITYCQTKKGTDGKPIMPPVPDPAIKGFDTAGQCIYYYSAPATPIACLYDFFPGGQGSGPIDIKALTTTDNGVCTINEVTQ